MMGSPKLALYPLVWSNLSLTRYLNFSKKMHFGRMVNMQSEYNVPFMCICIADCK